MKNWLDIANEVNTKFNESEFGKLTDAQIKRKERFICEKCGKENLDVSSYISIHSDNCKWSHITKEMILQEQSKFDTGIEIWESLNITRKKYVEFCNHFNIEFKSADLESIKKVSSKHNSIKLNVWKYDSTKKECKGEFIGSFKSILIASAALGINRVYIDDCIKKRYPKAKPKYIFEKEFSNRCFENIL
jgi:hypothetical protein